MQGNRFVSIYRIGEDLVPAMSRSFDEDKETHRTMLGAGAEYVAGPISGTDAFCRGVAIYLGNLNSSRAAPGPVAARFIESYGR